MSDLLKLTGIVLLAAPAGEYDKRVVILTKECGKITAFAKGVRRQNSPLLAAASPFAFGEFSCYEGRGTYRLVQAEIQQYFREITEDMEAACYGSYFLEFADYYGRENLEAVEMLKLLYQSLRALLKNAIPNRLVRAVFELKLMEINGEYMEKPLGKLEDSTIYTWEYVLASPVEKLYTFTVSEKVLEEFTKCVAENKRRFVDKTFHSLDILDVLVYK